MKNCFEKKSKMADGRLSYLRLGLLLYVIMITLRTINANCDETYDEFRCEYRVICEVSDYLDLNWNTFRRNNGYNYEFCTSSFVYNGERMIPINLTYKIPFKFVFDNLELPTPSRNGYGGHINNIIISLDLSNNNFSKLPTLLRMQHLVTLNLSQNSLRWVKLSNKYELNSLKELDLSHNTITDMVKEDEENNEPVYTFENLENINLSYNYLDTVPEGVFDSLGDLKILDMSHNLISSLGPISFEGIKKLEHLNMSHNKLLHLNASLFRFSELKTLDLSNNKIRAINTIDFNTLTKLTTLNLKLNHIATVEKDVFVNMRFLNTLDISNNKIGSLDRDIFKNVDNLEYFIVKENKFKTIPKSLFKGKNIIVFSIVENILEGALERGMFEGLQSVPILDLSNQYVESIGNNAFYGLEELKTLLLTNNNIKSLALKCFNMLKNLKQLDLSYNKINNIDFEKENLGNLESFSIRNNYLTVVKHEHFLNLDSLQFLDLSDNKISQLESNSFKALKNLISFEISNNPLNGTLEGNTFEGLNSLPSLDISCTLLTIVQNGSFNGMTQLKSLNISRSTIKTLQFNAFIHTGAVETLDLSYNNIDQFNINNTQISKLNILYLNNNHIKTLDLQTFGQMLSLTKIVLSFNEIESIQTFAFASQIYLRELDLSYNTNLMFNISLINNTNYLNELNLSGIKAGMTFEELENVPLSQVTIANASIEDVKDLKLNGLKHLNSLVLSHNKIAKVDLGCFTNISTLTILDLSFNKITFIQPGALKDNTMLLSLNISHNHLTTVTYGIFRGLIHLDNLDISYNQIDNLQYARFVELRSLNVLIADHNKIESINAEEFMGLPLSKLSIGDNPIPCNVLIKFKQSHLRFDITAIKLDEHNNENFKGITCNKNKDISYTGQGITDNNLTEINENIRTLLFHIRDINRDIFNKLNNKDNEIQDSKNEEFLSNITKQLAKISNNNDNQLINLTILTSKIANRNETNVLLEKILKVITINSLKRPTTVEPLTKNNATYDNLVNYINKLKQQLDDTIAFEKNSILNEVENKLSALQSKESANDIPIHEKLSVDSSESKSIFTETCVALILLILVCFILYKFYESGMFNRKRLSISTRELPDAMDSTL